MPLMFLKFPAFDPVLISIGPFQIRWYALSYICGILLGWLYARTIIVNERLWGGPAPLTVVDFDDFVLWVTLGIILGGRIGYVLFYNPQHFLEHPLEAFELWKGGMSFHGGFVGCVLAVVLFAKRRGIPVPVAGRPELAPPAPSASSSGAVPTSSTASFGVARPRCSVGYGVPQRRADAAASKPAL